MTASHVRPLSASSSPSRSPIRVSTSGNRPVFVLPRLNNVTLCPRPSARRTMCGPMKPVPPRIRMSRPAVRLFTVPAVDAVDTVSSPHPDRPSPSAPVDAAAATINSRRVVTACRHRLCAITSASRRRLRGSTSLCLLSRPSATRTCDECRPATPGARSDVRFRHTARSSRYFVPSRVAVRCCDP